MQVSEEGIQEAVSLLEDAHHRLLAAQSYGIDTLVYRAILLLTGIPAEGVSTADPAGMDGV